MAAPGTHNLTAYRGDSWAQSFRILASGTPVDLTGQTITSNARSTLGDLSELPVTVETDPGTFTIRLDPDMQPDLYDYDIQADDAGVITTWIRGRLRLLQDVTP